MLRRLDVKELEDSISLGLKKDDRVYKIPNSLKDAINNYMIANVIRDLRGQKNTHRSMMINVSRFTTIQIEVEQIVKEYVKEIQESIRLYGNLNDDIALKDKNIEKLYQTYITDFSTQGYTWDEIKISLLKGIEPIKVVSVNSLKKNTLNYEDGNLRVIAVGGFSLSRGLTLEGLMTSYMYGNTKMYDTLMQKGRWFGYRKGYEDLCTIWMTGKSIEWYESISDATDELRLNIGRMQEEGARPIEFGLMVRCDVDALEITARNKMRTAKEFTRNISLSEEVVETPKIRNDIDVNSTNKKCVDLLVKKINKNIEIDRMSNKYGIKCVNKQHIIDFLDNYEVSNLNYQFNVDGIKNFIKDYKGNELDEWDIVFISGSSDKKVEDYGANINYVKRSFELENENNIIRISGKRNRLGSQTDTIFGLLQNDIEKIKDKIINEKKPVLNQKDYFKVINRKPLLMIYFIELINKDNKNVEKQEVIEKYKEIPLVGIGIGIPKLENGETKYARYKVNIVGQESGISAYNYIDEEVDEGDE